MLIDFSQTDAQINQQANAIVSRFISQNFIDPKQIANRLLLRAYHTQKAHGEINKRDAVRFAAIDTVRIDGWTKRSSREKGHRFLSLDQDKYARRRDISPTPDLELEYKQAHAHLSFVLYCALDEISKQYPVACQVVSRWANGETLKAIGLSLGFTEGRASQLRKQALEGLRSWCSKNRYDFFDLTTQ